MGVSGIAIQPASEGNFEASVQFLIEWVSGSEAEARRYLADHAEPEGASLVAACGHDVLGTRCCPSLTGPEHASRTGARAWTYGP
jgi:hypothetical protein